MGLGFVLLIWAVIGIIVATVAAAAFAGFTAFVTRGVHKGRNIAIVAAALLPFGCLAWGGFVFAVQALVNDGVLHRDVGLGDASYCPLPNGYRILMIDVSDIGWVYNPTTQPSGGVTEREDAIAGVRLLDVQGRYILAAADSKAWTKTMPTAMDVDSYVLLDSQTGKRTSFENYAALQAAALRLGIQPRLQPIFDVYRKYRFTWFDVVAGLLFCIPPIIAGLPLIAWIVRLRGTRLPIPHAI
jgi:hypothetical protein